MLRRILLWSLPGLFVLSCAELAAGADVTFNREIAPILFQNCAPCHRPGQPAPFSLLSFTEAKKHARDIAKVTGSRYMPPWLPEHGTEEFEGERRLSDEKIRQIGQWVENGTPEGKPSDLLSPPDFREGWVLGKPDLVVQLPRAYTLAAEGADLYRNFVIPAPLKESRFVRAFEFHPRNRAVHHVRLKLDPNRQSRRLEAEESEPGFGGMRTPGRFPKGHMTTWVPGQIPAPVPEGLPWVLERDTDLVLQIHLQRTGREETIQPEIGFYFTSEPPSKEALLIGLTSESIDIPAGEKDYWIERTFKLPAAVEALTILPHMHYLGKMTETFVTLPNGTVRTLLRIPEWDFNWQGEYRFKKPVPLPAGTVLTTRWRFDNSAENPRNPNHPPRRVIFGPQTTDEMAEVWIQVLPQDPRDLPMLLQAQRRGADLETVAYYENQLRINPRDAAVHTALGKILGPLGRLDEALDHFRAAVLIQPGHAESHYYLGLSLLTKGQIDLARTEFETVLRLNPRYEKAQDGLGLIALRRGQIQEAIEHFRKALEINPDDPAALANLRKLDTER